MGLKITVLDTGPKTYAEKLARKEVLNRVFGVTSAVMANNGTTETKRKTKNKVLSIAIDSKEITPDKIMVYKAKLDEKDKTTLKADLRAIKFGFWLEDKDKKEVKLHENVAYIIRSNTEKRYLFDITTKDDLASTDHTTDFTDTETIEEFTIALGKHAFYYAKITRTETEAILEIKFSKWMDGYRIRMEAYYRSEKPLGDGGTTTASRFVWANPEIIDTYWMNAEGQKVNYAGYNQDLYLYLKTLGLKDKEVEVQVHEDDYYYTPSVPKQFPLSNNKKGDELIEWKNNQIKIDNNGEALKQFKVGNKERYEEAQKDEQDDYDQWYNDQIGQGHFLTFIDPSEKYSTDLELYIHVPDKDKLTFPKDNQFAKIILTEKTMIMDAYFGTTEEQKVQADAPATKKNPSPTGKVTHYQKLDKGVLGQTVQLIAECPNLEGKKVTFQIFDKTHLLGEKDKALTLIYKDEEKTRIEAEVKEGFAVAEVKLQHKKEHKDNKDWLDKLKNGFYDDDNKTAQLYLKVEATQNVFTLVNDGEFLKDTPLKMIGNNWHEPIKNPQRLLYNSEGNYSPRSGSFGTVRYKKDGGKKAHAGIDIFAPIGENVYACLEGEVVSAKFRGNKAKKTGYGNTILIKINKAHLDNSKNDYELEFKKDGEIEKSADFGNSDERYLLYAHLDTMLVTKGDRVVSGQKIGTSGKTGNAITITHGRNRHLHFEILDANDTSGYYEMKNRANAAFYVNFVKSDREHQKKNKD